MQLNLKAYLINSLHIPSVDIPIILRLVDVPEACVKVLQEAGVLAHNGVKVHGDY